MFIILLANFIPGRDLLEKLKGSHCSFGISRFFLRRQSVVKQLIINTYLQQKFIAIDKLLTNFSKEKRNIHKFSFVF